MSSWNCDNPITPKDGTSSPVDSNRDIPTEEEDNLGEEILDSSGRNPNANPAVRTHLISSAQDDSFPNCSASGGSLLMTSPADSSLVTDLHSKLNLTRSGNSRVDLPPVTSVWEFVENDAPCVTSRSDACDDPVDLLRSYPKKPSILKKCDQNPNSSSTTQCVSFEIDLVDEPLRRTKSIESNLSFDSETGYWSEISDQSSPGGGILKHGLSSSSGGSLGSSRRSSEDFSKDGEGKSILRRSSLGSTACSESGLHSILKRKLSDTTGSDQEFHFNRSYSSVSLPETKTILKSTEYLNEVESVQLKPILKKSSDDYHSRECNGNRIRPILKKNSRSQRSSSTGSILKTARRKSGILKNGHSHFQEASSSDRSQYEDTMDRTDSEEELILTLSVAERTSLFMQYERERSGLSKHGTGKCVKGRGRAATQPITTVEMLQALSLRESEQTKPASAEEANQPMPGSPTSPEVIGPGQAENRVSAAAAATEEIFDSSKVGDIESKVGSNHGTEEVTAETNAVQSKLTDKLVDKCSTFIKAVTPQHASASPQKTQRQEVDWSHAAAAAVDPAGLRRQSVPITINYFHGSAPEIRRIPPNDPESFVRFFSSSPVRGGEEHIDDASFASVVESGRRRGLLGTRRSVRVKRNHKSSTNPVKSSQRISKQYYLQPSGN